MNTDFWSSKRVLITGHTGFKGSWLSLWLQQMGADVWGLSLPPLDEKNLFDQARIETEMHSIIGDIRDAELVDQTFSDCEPDIVFHLAAQALVRTSYTDPVETISTNVMGTVNILEAVRKCPSVKSVVIVTSDKCYENNEQNTSYKETDLMGGKDPYSASKACAEIVASSYRLSFFNGKNDHPALIATARAGNVVGGGDWSKDRLVPDIMNAFMNQQPLILRNPAATRPWQHVLEPLSGYMMLGEKLWNSERSFAEAWNFGPENGEVYTVEQVVNYLMKSWGRGASWEQDASVQPYEAQSLTIDSTKAIERLDWKPKWSLETTLHHVIDSYKSFHSPEEFISIIKEQISLYSNSQIQGQ